MRRTVAITAFALAAAFAAPAAAQGRFDNVAITAVEVADGVHMLQGAGGNIAVLAGPEGVIMVDDQYAPLTGKIQAAVSEISDTAIRFVVNTHWHGDHTGGNENLGEAGAVIVAHDNVRQRMSMEQFNRLFGRATPPSPDAALPIVTFSDEVTFHLNGETVRVQHMDPAHTDGDAIVRFVNADVIHMGDIFFNGGFPFIDVDSGGSLDGAIAALEAVASQAGPETKIIPGHGPLASAADMLATIDMLKTVRARIQARIDAGDTEDEAVAAAPLKALEAEWGQGFINAERMVRTGYRSLKG